ncbi:hypothetical protein Q8309_001380 [Salmonella enterica]|nr:hypothetical protein [Salmonella enterica]
MTTDKYHAVERVDDARPVYALPLNAERREAAPVTVSLQYAQEVLSAPEHYHPAVVAACEEVSREAALQYKAPAQYIDPMPWRAYEILLNPDVHPDNNVRAAQRLADRLAGDVPLTEQLAVLLRIAKSKGYKPKAGLGDAREAFLRAKEKKERAARKARAELTETVKDDIRTRLLKGQTTRYIADKVGTTMRTVQRIKASAVPSEAAVAP